MTMFFLILGWMFILFLINLAMAFGSAIIAEVYEYLQYKPKRNYRLEQWQENIRWKNERDMGSIDELSTPIYFEED